MRNRTGRFDRLKAGTGHDGKSRAFAKPGEATLSTHHDPNEARAGDVGLAPHFMKPAARKALHPVAVHNGMHPRQIAAAGIGGMAHATGYVDEGGTAIPNSAAAVPHAYGSGIPKVRDAAPINPGMVSNVRPAFDKAALGRALLDEALSGTARRHGIDTSVIDTLPRKVK